MFRIRKQQTRGGLTLMELVVVLSILAALAAIVIPLFPNMLRRAHKATDATQTSEMAKLIQTFNALYYSYPDGFDMLTDGSGTWPDYLPWDKTVSPTAPFGGMVTAAQLTANEVAALSSVGINKAAPLAPAGTTSASNSLFHPTMWPYTDTTPPTTISTSQSYAILDRTGIQANNPRFMLNELSSDPTARFIVFGVGPKCAMVGRTIQDPPQSVPQKSNFTPDNTYSRVGVIFQIGGTMVANGDNRAIFVRAVALEDDEIEATDKDVSGYYQAAKDPRLP